MQDPTMRSKILLAANESFSDSKGDATRLMDLAVCVTRLRPVEN